MLEILSIYFNNLLTQEDIPKGYHKLDLHHDNQNVILTFRCTSMLGSVNKLIPKIENDIITFTNNVLGYLRHNFIEYDFNIKNIQFLNTIPSGSTTKSSGANSEIRLKMSIFRSYLDLSIIPSDILVEIISYLKSKEDYFNLVDVIKLKEYPELITKLKRIILLHQQRLDAGSIYKITEEDSIDRNGDPLVLRYQYIDGRMTQEEIFINNRSIKVKMWYPNGNIKSVTTENTFQYWDNEGDLLKDDQYISFQI